MQLAVKPFDDKDSKTRFHCMRVMRSALSKTDILKDVFAFPARDIWSRASITSSSGAYACREKPREEHAMAGRAP